jgi:hypothetical protein
MITLRTGPAFREPRTLAEQLQASLYLVAPTVTDEQLVEAHRDLDALVKPDSVWTLTKPAAAK